MVTNVDGRGGQAFLEGTWWRIRPRDGELTEGREVVVVATEGLELIVEEDNP